MEFLLSKSLTQGASPPFSSALLPCLHEGASAKPYSSRSAGAGEERRWRAWTCHQLETLCSCVLGDKHWNALSLRALGSKVRRNLDQSPRVPTCLPRHCAIIPPCTFAGNGETGFYSTERTLSVLHTELVSELGVKSQPGFSEAPVCNRLLVACVGSDFQGSYHFPVSSPITCLP